MATTLRSASRYRNLTALLIRRLLATIAGAPSGNHLAIGATVATYQATGAATAQQAVAAMLAEQDLRVPPQALLNPLAFTTAPEVFAELAQTAEDRVDQADAKQQDLDRGDRVDTRVSQLAESLVQEAMRAAEQVSITTRRDIYHVRFVSPPCCSRCAILAGRVYRWSDGFLRHPGCDCSMIPTTLASPLRQDPMALVEDGQVRGLSKADMRALADGADLNQLVNVRLRKGGVRQSGEVLRRGSRPTPAAIYRKAGDDRDMALRLLTQAGYIRTPRPLRAVA